MKTKILASVCLIVFCTGVFLLYRDYQAIPPESADQPAEKSTDKSTDKKTFRGEPSPAIAKDFEEPKKPETGLPEAGHKAPPRDAGTLDAASKAVENIAKEVNEEDAKETRRESVLRLMKLVKKGDQAAFDSLQKILNEWAAEDDADPNLHELHLLSGGLMGGSLEAIQDFMSKFPESDRAYY